MRIGIASSQWRHIDELPFTAYLDFARQVGAEVVDISISAGWPESRPETLRFDDHAAQQLRAAMNDTGITVTAFGGPDDFVQADAEVVAVHLALVKRLIDFALAAEVPVVTLMGGSPKLGMSLEQAAGLLTSGLKQVVPHAEQKGIVLALENCTSLTNNMGLLLRVLHGVPSPILRVLLDTKSLLNHGHSPDSALQAIGTLAPLAVHTHIGNNDGWGPASRPAPLGSGVLGMDTVIATLRNAHYQGPYCVQIEAPDDPKRYAEDIAYLRAHLSH
jgi:hydroxypyruvate isomerase